MAERLRNDLAEEKADFTFETVLSTERHLVFLRKAKKAGYNVRCIYVLTCKADINVARVRARVRAGGHDVPENKIRKRYAKALKLLPQLIDICDEILIYDNSIEPALIFHKNKERFFGMGTVFPTEIWPLEKLKDLLKCRYGILDFRRLP